MRYMHLSPAAKSAAIEHLNHEKLGDIEETAPGVREEPLSRRVLGVSERQDLSLRPLGPEPCGWRCALPPARASSTIHGRPLGSDSSTHAHKAHWECG